MRYIAIFLFCIVQIVLAEGDVGMANPDAEIQKNSSGYTQSGIAEIQKYDGEIRGLFDTINKKLDEIDKKFNSIKKIIDSGEDSYCSAFDDIKIDIDYVDSRLAEAKGSSLSSDDLKILSIYKRIYVKSYNEFKFHIKNTGMKCHNN